MGRANRGQYRGGREMTAELGDDQGFFGGAQIAAAPVLTQANRENSDLFELCPGGIVLVIRLM
jgi:hypothetical protein